MVTADTLYDTLKGVKIGGSACQFHHDKCAEMAPVINEINELKWQKNAVILAHTYVSPEIIYGVADFNGDSYGLSKDAQGTQADIIVFAAVRFMAETAKILNPRKEVLVPSSPNGCTLADSITARELKALKAQYPGYAFVCYINTTAEVKAQCDVCVTSANVYDIVEAYPSDKIYFIPDKLMGLNLRQEMARRGVAKHIELHHGTCYVHEKYDPSLIDYIKLRYPGTKVLSHPECSTAVVQHSDFIGSTSQMINYVKQSPESTFLMLTECGLAGRLQLELPQKHFVGSCTLCRYMKANSLKDILQVLKNPRPEQRVELEGDVGARALHCLQQMFKYAEAAKAKK